MLILWKCTALCIAWSQGLARAEEVVCRLDSASSWFAGAMADADGFDKAIAFVQQMAVSATFAVLFWVIVFMLAAIGLDTVCNYVGSFLPDIEVKHVKRIAIALGCCILCADLLHSTWLGLILLFIVFLLALFFHFKYLETPVGPWILAAMQGQSKAYPLGIQG